MNCNAYRKQISMLLDGALDETDAATLKGHMEGCADCRIFHDRILNLDRSLRADTTSFVSPDLAEQIKANLAARRLRRGAREFLLAWRWAPALALVLVLALGIGNLAGRSLNNMWTHQRADAFFDQLMPGQNGWVSDAFMEMGSEEQSR